MVTSQIGRYQVLSILGRGGMATVYRAFDPLFEREVAVKILPPDPGGDPSGRLRFEREAKTIASLEHPAIVPVYDVGEEAGQPYLVMRLMLGGSLTDRIREGPVPLPEIDRLLARLAPALDEAHARGVIHRDLKPANILFDQREDPYLSDFGIAKLAQSSTVLTISGLIGTPAYMSPEQAQGDRDIGASSDLYSLGVILFELLTGQQPFQAETPTGQMFKHVHEPVPSVHKIKPALSWAFDEVLRQAMAKDPGMRYATARELAQAVSGAVRAGALRAGPSQIETRLEPVATFVERRPDLTGPGERPAQARQKNAETAGAAALPAPAAIASRRWRPGRLAVYGFLAFTLFIFLVAGGAGFWFLAPSLFGRGRAVPAGTEALNPPAEVQAVLPNTETVPGEAAPGTLPAMLATITPSQPAPATAASTATQVAAIVPTDTPSPARPLLILDRNYFCRGGPGTDSDQIWSFSEGTELDIVGRSANGWWLVRFEDDRTRHDQCWISGGTVAGDPDGVPVSDYRTSKQPPGAAVNTAAADEPAGGDRRATDEADEAEPEPEEPATETPPTEEPATEEPYPAP
jgi:serine/threonine-protein kinase